MKMPNSDNDYHAEDLIIYRWERNFGSEYFILPLTTRGIIICR